MTIPIIQFGGLDDIAQRCWQSLIDTEPYEFRYPDAAHETEDWTPFIDVTKDDNSGFLENLRGNANLYILLIRAPTQSDWNTRYIGESRRELIRQRLTDHLITKDPRTGSQLKKVRLALSKGFRIGVSLLLVEPEVLRLAAEESVLGVYHAQFPWNSHGSPSNNYEAPCCQ